MKKFLTQQQVFDRVATHLMTQYTVAKKRGLKTDVLDKVQA